MNVVPLLAANFGGGGGGGWDFSGMLNAARGFASSGTGAVILIFAVLAIAMLTVVLASRGGKTEVLAAIGAIVLVGSVFLVIIAFATAQANADLIGYVTTHASIVRHALA